MNITIFIHPSSQRPLSILVRTIGLVELYRTFHPGRNGEQGQPLYYDILAITYNPLYPGGTTLLKESNLKLTVEQEGSNGYKRYYSLLIPDGYTAKTKEEFDEVNKKAIDSYLNAKFIG
jgi:hypothetical protein